MLTSNNDNSEVTKTTSYKNENLFYLKQYSNRNPVSSLETYKKLRRYNLSKHHASKEKFEYAHTTIT